MEMKPEILSILLVVCNIISGNTNESNHFPLAIIHINDFHARFDEVNNASEHCRHGIDHNCFGGYARLVSTVKTLQHKRQALNPLYLNAGDNFQGTFWYNVGRWNITAEFLNMLPADAITIGNHEFTHQIEGLVPFLRALNSPVVVSNMDTTHEPTMKNTCHKSLIINRFNRKIGIIGLILSTVNEIAPTGRLRFLDEVETTRKESAALRAQGVDIIIVLSHCGLEKDLEIARNSGSDVDIIVGGHSHTLLYNGDRSPTDGQTVDGVYPIVVRQPDDGHQTLVVQASAYAQFVGDLIVWFDDDGELVRWDGNPIFLKSSITKDAAVELKLQEWRKRVEQAGHKVIGTNRVPMWRRTCFSGECILGNFIADATAEYYLHNYEPPNNGAWTKAAVVLFNVGAIRANLNVGNISIADLMTIFPYENTMDYVVLSGATLLDVLEHSVSRSYYVHEFNSPYMIQYAGLQVVFNISQPVGKRVVKANVLCNICPGPMFEPLQMNRDYSIITTSYLTSGFDDFDQFPKHMKNHTTGPKDIDVFTWFANRYSPVIAGRTGRIQII